MADLYRHFNADGELLYAGISLSTFVRLAQHKSTATWYDDIATVEIEKFPTREEAMMAETLAIQNENPAYNIMKSSLVTNRPEPNHQRRFEQVVGFFLEEGSSTWGVVWGVANRKVGFSSLKAEKNGVEVLTNGHVRRYLRRFIND